jgi:hypothetical protein
MRSAGWYEVRKRDSGRVHERRIDVILLDGPILRPGDSTICEMSSRLLRYVHLTRITHRREAYE